MKKWVIGLLLVGLACLPVWSARAQSAPVIGELKVALWPEYDQPSVLVIYYITLAQGTTLPASLNVRIPASSGLPNAVAVKQPDGQLVNLEYETSSDGTWTTIQLVANLPELQIEYYDPGLAKEGVQRSYTYEWPADYAVEDLVIEIQQPLDASDLSVSPGPVSSRTGGDGLTYFTKQVGQVAAGQAVQIDLEYQKSSDILSAAQLEVQPSAPLTTQSSWQDKMLGALPWVLGVLGVSLIAGGAIWYWQSGRQTAPARTRRSRARSAAAEDTSPADSRADSAVSQVYCHQCGKRAASGDRFCRSCGTRLRVE